jgi:hypothetical protein
VSKNRFVDATRCPVPEDSVGDEGYRGESIRTGVATSGCAVVLKRELQ